MDKMHEERLSQLTGAMQERSIDYLWVEPSVGFFYLTGIEALSSERLTGLLVASNGELRLLVPLLLRDEFAGLAPGADQFVWDDAEGPDEAASSVLAGVKTIHVQGSLPMSAFDSLSRAAPSLEVELDPGILSGLRERKDGTELEHLRRSSELSDEVVEWIASLDLNGVTERQLAGRIRARYLELGYEPGEWALVATGANAAMPHYAGGDVPISVTEPLLTDFGGAVEGYWSDITRVHFPRDADAEVLEAHEVVCAAAGAAFEKAGVGVPCRDVDRAARKVIEDAGYGDYFIHRTGHGLGLEVHEAPYITGANERLLEPGHVFTIEPGIYLPSRWGLRYENVVHIGEDEPESLNKSPRVHYLR